MSEIIKKLFSRAVSKNEDDVMYALTDMGLMIERHTQNRYEQEEYLQLMDNNYELYEYHLVEEDVEQIISFLFYHILNIHIHPVTVVWCLGKCYNRDIKLGMNNLRKLYKNEEAIQEQIVFSMTALFGSESIK